MTQVQDMTDQQLNRVLAELMGYTIKKLPIGANGRQLYALVTPEGRERLSALTIDNAYLDAPAYAGDPAASLEVQAAAIAKDKDDFLNNLTGVVAGYFPKSVNWDVEWDNDVIILLISASPRQTAEAAYITLQGEI